MGERAISYLMSDLTYQAPLIVVYMVAIVMALFFMDRHPRASVFAIGGSLIMLATGVGVAIAHAINFDAPKVDPEMQRLIAWLGVGGRTLGMGLLVAAIFSNREATSARSRTRRRRDDDDREDDR
jgi:MFS family permease